MRRSKLLLTVAMLALVPAVAFGIDAVKNAAPAGATAAAPETPAAPSAAASAPTAEPATEKKVFSDAQREEIESIIKDYVVNQNPQIIMDAYQNLQRNQMADASAKSKEAIVKEHDKIFSNPTSPVGGNPKGDVTIVEFFDYQCGYCKAVTPSIDKLLKEDKNIKFVYKDFPVLGPDSVTAAKAALAGARQDKYVKFHDALMKVQFPHGAGKPGDTEALIYKAAKDSGLDVEKLKKDMNDEAIEKLVTENLALGSSIGAHGTPTFIIGEEIYPGAMPYEELKKAVTAARGEPPKKKQ